MSGENSTLKLASAPDCTIRVDVILIIQIAANKIKYVCPLPVVDRAHFCYRTLNSRAPLPLPTNKPQNHFLSTVKYKTFKKLRPRGRVSKRGSVIIIIIIIGFFSFLLNAKTNEFNTVKNVSLKRVGPGQDSWRFVKRKTNADYRSARRRWSWPSCTEGAVYKTKILCTDFTIGQTHRNRYGHENTVNLQ